MENFRYTITIKFNKKFGEPEADPIIVNHKTLSKAIEDYHEWMSCADDTVKDVILVDNVTKSIINPNEYKDK